MLSQYINVVLGDNYLVESLYNKGPKLPAKGIFENDILSAEI